MEVQGKMREFKIKIKEKKDLDIDVKEQLSVYNTMLDIERVLFHAFPRWDIEMKELNTRL